MPTKGSTCSKTKIKVHSKPNIKKMQHRVVVLRGERRTHWALAFTRSRWWNWQRQTCGVMAHWSQAAGGVFLSGLKMISSEYFYVIVSDFHDVVTGLRFPRRRAARRKNISDEIPLNVLVGPFTASLIRFEQNMVGDVTVDSWHDAQSRFEW